MFDRICRVVIAGGLLFGLAGCGGGSSKPVFDVTDGPSPAANGSAPITTITQGFGVNDALGEVLTVVINYTLLDADVGDLASILVELSVRGCTDPDFGPWYQAPEAALGSEGTTDLSTSNIAPGQLHTFVVDAIAAGINGVGPIDLFIRITAFDSAGAGPEALSGQVHVGAPGAQVRIGVSNPGVSPSFGNQVPVSVTSNNLPVDEVTIVASFTPGDITLSASPVVLGPAATTAGATIIAVNVGPGTVEATIGGGAVIQDGTFAFLQFDIAASASGGSFPIFCVDDVPTGSGTRGRFMGQRQCVECAPTDGAVLLSGAAPGISIGISNPLAVPSVNNCIPVNFTSNGRLLDLIAVTVGYDASQVVPSNVPVLLGSGPDSVGALLSLVDTTIPGELSFTIGGGGSLPDGELAQVCFDVLAGAPLGTVPIPCLDAFGSAAGTPSLLQCSTGGSLVLAFLNATISVSDYLVPMTIDPVTMCLVSNLNTIGDPLAVPPVPSNTVDILLTTLGNDYDQLSGTLVFDSNLLSCPATGSGITIGPAAPPMSTLGMTTCDDSMRGALMGEVQWSILSPPGVRFPDGAILLMTFDVPGPSPVPADTPMDHLTPVLASVVCGTVNGAFSVGATGGIACAPGGSVQIRAPCVTRVCTDVRVYGGVDGAPDAFTLPTTDPINGPLEFDNDVYGTPLILTGIGDGLYDGANDRGDQQLVVYAIFDQPPLVEFATLSAGAAMSGGMTEYAASPGSGVTVDSDGLVTAIGLNCCDTITVTYTPNSVAAVGLPCVTDIVACVDAAGPDDLNVPPPMGPAPDLRAGSLGIGNMDATIPGLPSGVDPTTIAGAGGTFNYEIWINTGTSVLGEYSVGLFFDGTVLDVDPTNLLTLFVAESSLGLPSTFNLQNRGAATAQLVFNDFLAAGSTEVGIFKLVSVVITVLGPGQSTLRLSMQTMSDEMAAPLNPGLPADALGATATTCPVDFP